MSLFGNADYQWRETYLILFPSDRRPLAEKVESILAGLKQQYEIRGVQTGDDGLFDALTLISPDDYAAMDVSYVCGEEVIEQTRELTDELKAADPDGVDRSLLARLGGLDARFDIYHFEEVVTGNSEEDEFMDPGCLLQVMEELTQLVDGVGVDPASGALL